MKPCPGVHAPVKNWNLVLTLRSWIRPYGNTAGSSVTNQESPHKASLGYSALPVTAQVQSAAAVARLQQKASSPVLKRVAAVSTREAQSQRASVSHLQTEDEALAWALQQSPYEAELQGHR
ncbi:uncharacterized protein LOC119466022 isoform X1 [Dermacentor silvarum]|uniref:uncharacterized protein LOC119466022 isoform X1 n=1 Tax=Dermacentor silvarum TaxID=543639 RepID=UPI00189AA16E|nr:uncharacterized protein LOC119466022 isoform X1 [Dermacentor silvarum]